MQKDIIGVIQNFNFCLKIDNLRYYRKVNISGGNKKNMWYEWVFSGIGTSILMGIIGFFVGYKIGVHKSKIKQIQKAKDESKQTQIGTKCDSDIVRNTINQKQTAGNKVEQIQIGEN